MKIWVCPNKCEIETVLVCGGDLGQIDKPNVYFHMELDGTYTQLHADGYGCVPKECHKHADGGCNMEPLCPECRTYCKQEVSLRSD